MLYTISNVMLSDQFGAHTAALTKRPTSSRLIVSPPPSPPSDCHQMQVTLVGRWMAQNCGLSHV